VRKPRKKHILMPIFDGRVANSLGVLAKTLNVQLKEIKRWRVEGLISYPLKEDEFNFLVKYTNIVWGNFRSLRCQLARMSTADRLSLVRTAELNTFEIEVYNLVLRWKIIHPKRYLKFTELRKILKDRFPNAFQQFNGKMLKKAKKRANYEITSSKSKGQFDLLLKQLDLEVTENGKVISKRKVKISNIGEAKLADFEDLIWSCNT